MRSRCHVVGIVFLLSVPYAGTALADIDAVARIGTSGNCAPSLEVGALGENVPLYCDRSHVFKGVPDALVGTSFVLTSNGDRSQADLGYEVTVTGEGALLLFIDNRVGDDDGDVNDHAPLLGSDPMPMSWVVDAGFQDTGADIGIDENADGDINQTYSIFALDVGEGQQTVMLGAQDDGDGRNDYLIAFAEYDRTTMLRQSLAPAGWLSSRVWNFLFPLGNPASCDPGVAMSADWLAPHDLAVEDPQAGDIWDDIDFADTARASGWLAESVGLPTWHTLDSLESSLGLAPGTLPTRELVNFEVDFSQFINNALAGTPDFVPLPEDDILGIATTYVENLNLAPLEVDICSASDDSIQVWVNDTPVTNVHACRGSSGGCQERLPAILPPGVSKITAFVWQGGGGHNFRLALEIAGERIADSNADDVGLIFHGPTPPNGTGTQANYAISRVIAPADSSACGETTVTLSGNGIGEAGDPVTLVETVVTNSGPRVEPSDISPAPSSVQDVMKASGMTSQGFIGDWLLIGPFTSPSAETESPGEDVIRADWLRNADGSITEANVAPRAGDTVNTDFGASATATGLAGPDGIHPGGVPTWNEWSDGDDTINLGDYYSGGIDQIVVVGFTYFCLEQDTELVVALASDDSIQCLVDGAERIIVNAGRGYGGANEIQNRADLGLVSAGKHTIMVKVFDGGGDHGFRLRLEDPAGNPVIDPAVVRLSLGPDDDPCGGSEAIGTTITWALTRGDVDAGLSYTLSTDATVTTQHDAVASGIVTSVGGPSSAILQSVAIGAPEGEFDGSFDSGSVPTPGSIIDNGGGSYTIAGSGSDIWNGGDHMFMAYQKVTGDFVATMRVTDVQNPPNTRYGRLGIMARRSCHQSSKYSLACVPYRGEDPANNDTRRHQSRRDHLDNGNTRDRQVLPADASATMDPVLGWVRLTRVGNRFFSEFAVDVDGQPGRWYLAGGDTWSAGTLEETLLVGPVSSSHSSAGANPLVYTFDSWSVEPVDSPPTECAESDVVFAADFDEEPPADLAADPLYELASSNVMPSVVDGRLRLTEDATTDTIAHVIVDPGAGNDLGSGGFVLELDAWYGGAGESADGMSFFVIPRVDQSTALPGFPTQKPLGGGGGELAWRRLDHNQIPAGRTRSFAVELDFWDGGADSNDPPGGHGANAGPDDGYHVGVNVSEESQSTQTNVEFGASLPSIYDDGNDGNAIFSNTDPLHIAIAYEPLTASVARLDVRVNRGSDEPRTVLDSFVASLEGDIAVGFAGATGGSTADQEVDNIVLSRRCCETVDEVSIAGATESDESDVVLTASLAGVDGPMVFTWEVVADDTGGATISDHGDGTATVSASVSGSVTVRVTAGDETCADEAFAEHTIEYNLVSPELVFYRMDDNNDGSVNISDPLYSLNYQFVVGPGFACLAAADNNSDGEINLSDPVFSLNYQFVGGPAPAEPFVAPPNCGSSYDPDDLALGCEASSCPH